MMEDMLRQILSEIKGLKQSVNGLEQGMGGLRQDIDGLKSQVNENAQILKALEHKVDVIKAEQESMKYDIAEIKGGMEDLKDTQNSLLEMYGEHEAHFRTLRRRTL